jgi:excisionase family DNA binding protein
MSVQEAAEFLGYSLKTLYQKNHAHEIPHFKMGNKLWYSREDLEKYMERNTVRISASYELSEQADAIISGHKQRRQK